MSIQTNLSEMDSRLKLLSHSSLCLLHSCPRKYQLQKLWPTIDIDESIDQVYGKMFHTGIQHFLTGMPIEQALLLAATEWKFDLYETKKEKGFFHCWNAINTFAFLFPETELVDYEVLEYNGKPAIELGFSIKLPNGFYYRGWIDVVLKHKITGEILVVDLKTSGMKFSSPSKYQHSAQNVGYSVVLESVMPGLQTFNVMYYEYLTSVHKFIAHTFLVDPLDRAIWIRDLLIECDVMQYYNNYSDWPKHGESCSSFGKSCYFIDYCTTPLELLLGETDIVTEDAAVIDKQAGQYAIEINIMDLINSQQETLV